MKYSELAAGKSLDYEKIFKESKHSFLQEMFMMKSISISMWHPIFLFIVNPDSTPGSPETLNISYDDFYDYFIKYYDDEEKLNKLLLKLDVSYDITREIIEDLFYENELNYIDQLRNNITELKQKHELPVDRLYITVSKEVYTYFKTLDTFENI